MAAMERSHPNCSTWNNLLILRLLRAGGSVEGWRLEGIGNQVEMEGVPSTGITDARQDSSASLPLDSKRGLRMTAIGRSDFKLFHVEQFALSSPLGDTDKGTSGVGGTGS